MGGGAEGGQHPSSTAHPASPLPGCSAGRQGGGTPPLLTRAPLPCSLPAPGGCWDRSWSLPGWPVTTGRVQALRPACTLCPNISGWSPGCSTHTGRPSPRALSNRHEEPRGAGGAAGSCQRGVLLPQPQGQSPHRAPALAAGKTRRRRPAAGRPCGSSLASPRTSRANGSCSQTCSRTH